MQPSWPPQQHLVDPRFFLQAAPGIAPAPAYYHLPTSGLIPNPTAYFPPPCVLNVQNEAMVGQKRKATGHLDGTGVVSLGPPLFPSPVAPEYFSVPKMYRPTVNTSKFPHQHHSSSFSTSVCGPGPVPTTLGCTMSANPSLSTGSATTGTAGNGMVSAAPAMAKQNIMTTGAGDTLSLIHI